MRLNFVRAASPQESRAIIEGVVARSAGGGRQGIDHFLDGGCESSTKSKKTVTKARPEEGNCKRIFSFTTRFQNVARASSAWALQQQPRTNESLPALFALTT